MEQFRERPDWDDVWLRAAELLSERSLCAGGAGACIVAADNRVMFPGYAGPPASQPTHNVKSCTEFCERHLKALEERDPGYQDCQSIHGEQNALIHADRTLSLEGTAYISRKPCWTCEKMIRNSGVARYVYRIPPNFRRIIVIEEDTLSPVCYNCGG